MAKCATYIATSGLDNSRSDQFFGQTLLLSVGEYSGKESVESNDRFG